MERTTIPDQAANEVTGGSIVFTQDLKTCGYNCNNQFIVNDFDAVIQYINENRYTMDERSMLKTMMQMGYITRI